MFDFLKFGRDKDKVKILVVDDEPKIVQTLQDRLEMNGYEVFCAYNGKEGLEKALDKKPDVILLDLLMPIMNGHEMLEALRQEPEGEDIAVIILTARSQKQDVERATASGISDYIVKPFEVSELLAKIETLVEEKRAISKK